MWTRFGVECGGPRGRYAHPLRPLPLPPLPVVGEHGEVTAAHQSLPVHVDGVLLTANVNQHRIHAHTAPAYAQAHWGFTYMTRIRRMVVEVGGGGCHTYSGIYHCTVKYGT